MSEVLQRNRCPYGDVICVEGGRYRPVEDAAQYPHPLDRPGLLYSGQCRSCLKVSKGSDARAHEPGHAADGTSRWAYEDDTKG